MSYNSKHLSQLEIELAKLERQRDSIDSLPYSRQAREEALAKINADIDELLATIRAVRSSSS